MEEERTRAVLQALWDEGVRLVGIHTVLLMAERVRWDLEQTYPEARQIRFGSGGWELDPLLALERGSEVAARVTEAFLALYGNLMGEASVRQLQRRVDQVLAAGGGAEKGATG